MVEYQLSMRLVESLMQEDESRRDLRSNSSSIDSEKDAVRVDMFEVKRIDPSQVAEIAGLGPCLGIVLYDSLDKMTVAGHMPGPEHWIEDALDENMPLFRDPTKVTVFLGGMNSSWYPGASVDTTEEDRAEVISALTKRNILFANIIAKWPTRNTDRIGTNMVFDPGKGEIEYDFWDQDTGESEYLVIKA